MHPSKSGLVSSLDGGAPILAKETLTWTVASGTVLLYKGILHANHEPRFFHKTASATIAPTVFLTFFINLTALGLLAELALQLVLVPAAMLSTFAHASSDKTHHAVGRLCDGLLSLAGLSWFIYTVIHVWNIWHQLDVHLVAQKLLLPMWLTLGLLPFIYVLSVYVAYQRPLGIIKSQTQVFRVRCRAIVAIISTLGLKVRGRGRNFQTFSGSRNWSMRRRSLPCGLPSRQFPTISPRRRTRDRGGK